MESLGIDGKPGTEILEIDGSDHARAGIKLLNSSPRLKTGFLPWQKNAFAYEMVGEMPIVLV